MAKEDVPMKAGADRLKTVPGLTQVSFHGVRLPIAVTDVPAQGTGHGRHSVVSRPGERLAEELRALHMSASELARRIRVPTNRVTEILNGQRAITGDTALRLAHFFGTSAALWLNLQSQHDLRVAEAKVGAVIQQLPTLKSMPRARRRED